MSKLTVLFLCNGNSARSQMAEAFVHKYAPEQFNALSAGLNPRPIHPLTTQVMQEVGIDIQGQRSKSVSEFLGKTHVHLLINVCQREEEDCPVAWPGSLSRENWPFEDPARFEGAPEEQLAKFREVRDQIDQRVQAWLSRFPTPASARE